MKFQEDALVPSLFSSASAEELGHYFSAAVDAENAIRLRESALLADIGDCIEVLSTKLKFYDRDQAIYKRAADECELIRGEADSRDLDINFFGVEYHRRYNRLHSEDHSESFMEANNLKFHKIQPILDSKKISTYLAEDFLRDPMALREHRLLDN